VYEKRGPKFWSCAQVSKTRISYSGEEPGEDYLEKPGRRYLGLKKLLDAGLIEAGKGVITRTLRSGESTTADLQEDGQIVCEVKMVTSQRESYRAKSGH
jgi:hypothetical protein